MKAPVNGGDLVEQMIFQAYKDRDVKSAKLFKEDVSKNYGYKASSELYKKIVNYQIKKYGNTLQNTNHIEYIKWFGLKDKKHREKCKSIADRREKTARLIERAEKNES